MPRHLSRLLGLVCLFAAAVTGPAGGLAPAAPTKAAGATTALASADRVARELAAGETQVFEISLSARQCLRLSVEKGDLNISLTVYGPLGQELIEHTSRRYESLDESFVAGASGQYRVEVRSLESGGAARRLELSVTRLRAATERDAKESAARSFFAEAARFREEWEEVSLRAAAERYMAATKLWRASGDARGAADGLAGAAEVHFTLGEYRKALVLYREAAAQSRAGGDSLGEAHAVGRAARLYTYLGDNGKAQRLLNKSLGYYSQHTADAAARFRQRHAEALSDAAEVYYSKGDSQKTSELLEHSLRLFAEVGDRGGEARARLFVGHVSNAIGQREKALAQFDRALALYRAVGDKSGEALALTALGVTHSKGREEAAALNLHRAALEIFRKIGDRLSEAVTLNGIGQAHENLNEPEVALANYEQALKNFEADGSLDFASVTLYQIAGIYRAAGDSGRALKYYDRCARLSHAARKARMEAYALKEIVAIYAAQGRREQTLRQYSKILKFYVGVNDRRGESLALNDVGDYFTSLGDAQSARRFYLKALPLSRQAGERGVEISTLYNAARAARDCGDPQEALSYAEQSIRIIETLRSNISGPDFRSFYFSGVYKQYELYIDLLMRMEQARPGQGFASAALLAAESARARSLLEVLSEVGADLRADADPALLQRERELQQMLKAQSLYQMELASGGGARDDAAEVARGIEQLRVEYQEVEARLRQQRPRDDSAWQSKPLSPEAIQAELGDDNTLLLEYVLGDEKSYLWAVTSHSLNAYELPPRAALEDAAREVRALLTTRQLEVDASYQARVEESDRAYAEKALALSRALLGPAAGQLGDKRLLVVAEGALQYIPFDALPVPADGPAAAHPAELPLLVSQHEVVALPSASALAAIRRERRRPGSADKVLAVLADPVFSRDDERVPGAAGAPQVAAPAGGEVELSQRAFTSFQKAAGRAGLARLKYTSDEADMILASAPGGTTMVAKGFDASRETAMSPALGQYHIVHFATHGFINSENPELSGIVLSMVGRDGSTAEGFLQLHDIYNLNLSADLVVLSACDTGWGKDIKGEGLIGLTRGFMYAGSKGVIASLWKVDDQATAELMGHFYSAVLQRGQPPAAALREAKEAMRQQKRWKAPYFWAGFVLQGEYRERIGVNYDAPARARAALLLVPLLLAAVLFIFEARRRARRLRHGGPRDAAPKQGSG